ncbi:MAG: ABC transporter ATP-binding protein [Actinomycetota bacterium]|nr:ABC transporter ATP-binding protein [Actinomycetota bacterium]
MTDERPQAPHDDVPALLELRDVEASYGPYRALFGVSFSVPERTAVALVGSNGAGKSTVARVVSGLVRAKAGSVRFAGHDVTRWPAWRIARAGLAHAPEGRSVFASLTVEENLVLAARALGTRRTSDALDRAFGTFSQLAAHRHQLAGTLSGGEQRMLSLAKVLVAPQRLLVVDELSFGLAPAIVDEVFDMLRMIRNTGTSLLVIEQHVDRVLSISDRAVVLVRGRVAAEGAVADVGPAIERLLPAHPQWSA